MANPCLFQGTQMNTNEHSLKIAKNLMQKKFFEILDNNREFVNDYETFVLAFDTEFFGHWWLEGTWWLEEVFNYD